MRRAGRNVFRYSATDNLDDLPFKVGAGAGSGLVLKSDTFLELGSPTAGSCAYTLGTRDTSLIQDGCITLIGPDIQGNSPPVLPFGQVIIAGGDAFGDDDCQQLIQCQYTGNFIEGYMIKSRPGHIWARISNDVARRGFNFKFLGMALMKAITMQIPNVQVIEVLFVTAGKDALRPLNDIGVSAGEIARGLREKRWAEKGVDISECAFDGHCGNCSQKDVCDEIKKAIQRKKHGVQG